MQVEVYIDDIKMDVEETEISETKQINDFFEVKDRQTSYTNTFKLPKTEHNKSVLDGHGVVGVMSLWPYRNHKVTIYRDGLPTIQNGIGYLKDTSKTFNIYVYSENIDLFEKVKDRTLSDLKLKHLNHSLNSDNWIASFERNKPYVYAVADYGYTDGDTIVVDYQVPSLFAKWVWNQIFIENGYKWKYCGRGERDDYNPFKNEQWDQLAFTIDQGLKELKESIDAEHKLTAKAEKQTKITDTANIPFTGHRIMVNDVKGEVTEYLTFSAVTDADNMIINNSFGASYSKTRIRIQEEGYYKIELSGFVFNTKTESLAMSVEKNGDEIWEIDDGFGEGESEINEDNKLYLKQGDELFVRAKSFPDEDEVNYAYELTLDLWLDNTVNYVNFSEFFGKIKQKDFLKDIINFFGLVFRKNGDTYEFISMEELLNPLSRYANFTPTEDQVIEDWSDKFDRIEKEETTIGDYGRKNKFKYQYIDEEDNYADATIRVPDETLDSEKELVKRIYNAPDRSDAVIGNKQLRLCNLYEAKRDKDGSIKKVKENKTRPFFFKAVNESQDLKYKLFGATNANTYKGKVPFMRFSDLDWNYVLPQRYSAFANMISYGKKIQAKLFLSVLDIHQLDFFKLKYIKQLGGIFYLNKVKDFNAGKKTSVELIRVKSIEHKGEFSDDFNGDFNI